MAQDTAETALVAAAGTGAAKTGKSRHVGISYLVVVPGNPVTANLLWRKNRAGTTYTTREGLAWKRAVQAAAMDAGVEPIEGDVDLLIRYFHRHPKRRLDVDNILKPVIDPLKACKEYPAGIAFLDDKQVRRVTCEREFCPENPRIEVRIEESR